jgi:hypothetical protein
MTEDTIPNIDDDILLKQQEESLARGNGNDRNEEESETPIADLEIRQYKNSTEEEEDEGEPSNAEILLQLADDAGIILFKDQYKIPHASIVIRYKDNGEHTEILRVESNAFRRYLTKLYHDSTQEIIGSESVKNVIQILQARAEYDGETYPLSLRVAWHNDDIYFDMTNDKWECVRITPQGWQLERRTPHPMFTRYTQMSQVDPVKDYPDDIFEKFLELTNLKNGSKKLDDRLLLKVYIVTLFIPEIPHAMLVLHGEKGSSKSTLQRGLSITKVWKNALHASAPYQSTFDAQFESTAEETEREENSLIEQTEAKLG